MPKEPFKPIRKSAFMTFKQCQKKFWFSYFIHSEDYWAYNTKENQSEAAAKGDLFHAEVDDFFEKLDMEQLYEVTDINKITEIYRNKFSFSDTIVEGKTDMDEWFDYFSEVEAKRFMWFKENFTKLEFLKWYPPKHTEFNVSMTDDIDRTGHVDRIDYLPNEKAYCVVEYKTGRGYDLTKPATLTRLRAETGFYAVILNEMKLLDAPVYYWALINPRLKTFHIEKFPTATLRAVNNTYKGLVQKIKEGGDFKRNIGPLCMYCPYRRECFHGLIGEPKNYIIGRSEIKNDLE